MIHCLSEEDYDYVDGNDGHIESGNADDTNNKDSNNDATNVDPTTLALTVPSDDTTKLQPNEAWLDGGEDNDVIDIPETKSVKTSRIRKWLGRLFGCCVRKND